MREVSGVTWLHHTDGSRHLKDSTGQRSLPKRCLLGRLWLIPTGCLFYHLFSGTS